MRKQLSIAFYISGFMALYLSFHIYYSFFSNKLMLLPLTILCFGLVFSVFWLRTLNGNVHHSLFKVVQFSTYFLLGVGLYVFTFYLISDILRLFIKINPLHEGIVIVALALVCGSLGYVNTRVIREKEHTIYSDKIAQPLKVVVISDLHIGSADMTLAKLQRMVNKVNAQNPDFIILAGDIVDDASVQYQKLGYGKILQTLQGTQGVYATIGNHETYMGDVNLVAKNFASDGLKILDDSQEFFHDYNLNLVGITDVGRSGRAVKKANDFALTEDKFNLIVEHNPIRFDENSTESIDLQVSGHTHGGQIIHGYLMTSYMYTKPWGKLDLNNSTLITTTGVGSWGPPIRDVTYPEMVVLNIEPQK